jgi:uncharacterized membrane protein
MPEGLSNVALTILSAIFLKVASDIITPFVFPKARKHVQEAVADWWARRSRIMASQYADKLAKRLEVLRSASFEERLFKILLMMTLMIVMLFTIVISMNYINFLTTLMLITMEAGDLTRANAAIVIMVICLFIAYWATQRIITLCLIKQEILRLERRIVKLRERARSSE